MNRTGRPRQFGKKKLKKGAGGGPQRTQDFEKLFGDDIDAYLENSDLDVGSEGSNFSNKIVSDRGGG